MTMMISSFVIHVVLSYMFEMNIITSIVVTLPLMICGILLYFGIVKQVQHKFKPGWIKDDK